VERQLRGTQKARRHQESKRRPPVGEHNTPKLFLFLSRKLKSERTMQRIFEADTREEANRQADEWWSAAKGLRFIHRSQTPAGFRSNPAKRWVITIHYKEEAARRRLSDQSSGL
jgi:hypothetical protein